MNKAAKFVEKTADECRFSALLAKKLRIFTKVNAIVRSCRINLEWSKLKMPLD